MYLAFVFKAQQIREWIESIEEDTKTLKRLHTLALHSARPDEGALKSSILLLN